MTMFTYSISDILYGLFVVVCVLFWLRYAIPDWIQKARCKHDGGFNESQACDAYCRQCGKNLGFIDAARERYPERTE